MSRAPTRRTDRTATLEAAGRPLLGALLIAAAAACYATTAACARIMADELNPMMIGFLRNGFALAFTLPLVLRAGAGLWRSERWGLHLGRSLAAIASSLLWFWALPRVALADAVALFFTGPIFVALGGVLVFGERAAPRHWLAVALAAAGVLVVLRPGFADPGPGLLAVLLSAVAWAAMPLANKALARTDSVQQIVLLNLAIVAPLSLLLALPVWQWPSTTSLVLGAVQGLLGTAAHYCVARAVAVADASFVMPFDFLRLPFAAAIAWLAFRETPDLWTLAGALVIFAGTMELARHRRRP